MKIRTSVNESIDQMDLVFNLQSDGDRPPLGQSVRANPN